MGFHGSPWVFMVLHGSELVFHGSRWVFRIFHGSRLVFHVFRLVFIVFIVPVFFCGFHGARLVFHCSRSVFMVFRVFMVPGWFFIFHVENTLKLYSGPTIQSRPCRPKAGFGLVLINRLLRLKNKNF